MTQEEAARQAVEGQAYDAKAPRVLVYIASPYTIGDKSRNVRRSILTATMLADYGYGAYSPLLNHFQDLMTPRDGSFWLSQDLAIVERCDVVLRLEGRSTGADIEVARAKELNIRVVFSVDELLEEFPP